MKQIEYVTRTRRQHTTGMKEHGWTEDEHEQAMIEEMGIRGWIMCGVKDGFDPTFYFYRQIP